MVATVVGQRLCFIQGDSTEVKTLRNWPEGRIRLRLRNEEFAQAFVKTAHGIRRFYIAEVDGFWEPGPEIGANITARE